MKIPQGVKFPLKLEWWAAPPEEGKEPFLSNQLSLEEAGEATLCQIIDSEGTGWLATSPFDPHGFGQEEIDALTFIVEAANLMAEKPLELEPYKFAEFKLHSTVTGRMSCSRPNWSHEDNPPKGQPKNFEASPSMGNSMQEFLAECNKRLSTSPHFDRLDREETPRQRVRKKIAAAGLKAKTVIEGGQCNFDCGWAGRCNKPARSGHHFCEKHADMKCSGCGKPAVKECSETFQFVCGAPLCETCTHLFNDKGKSLEHGPKPPKPPGRHAESFDFPGQIAPKHESIGDTI